jgi:ribosomal protein S27AE
MYENKCPKCSVGKFLGPFYEAEKSFEEHAYNLHDERLRYVCAHCGYIKYEPCADAKPKEQP